MIGVYYNKKAQWVKYILDKWGAKSESSRIEIKVRVIPKYRKRTNAQGQDAITTLDILTKQVGIEIGDSIVIDLINHEVITIDPMYQFKKILYFRIGS